MNLDNFASSDPIFIDANIWTYYALNTEPFQESCINFLYRCEIGQITSVTSTAVLNEAIYAILIGKAAEEMDSTRIKQIHRQLQLDSQLAEICYQTCLRFTTYLRGLMDRGLQVITIDYATQISSLAIGAEYRLLPTDALHVATCQQYDIGDIATADEHFLSVTTLQVWQPSRLPAKI